MLGGVLGAESQKQSVLKPSNSLPSKFVFPGKASKIYTKQIRWNQEEKLSVCWQP